MISLLLAMSLSVTAPFSPPEKPVSLHPDNPRYLLYGGKPTVLVSSAEHYGAVLNLDFDFKTYLATMQRDGMNQARLFSGAYVENPGEFNIKSNTLAPARGRYICPWARSDKPGYPNGGNLFDLNKWDEAYFARLKEYCAEADRRGVIVEVVLFCPFYNDALWTVNPMNVDCNVSGVGDAPPAEVYTLKHADLTRIQEALTRKIVRELNGFNNIYYEICNEPYFGGVTLEWQQFISSIIAVTEASLPNRHLIAQNIANDTAKVTDPDPRVSIFNFHYASPPRAVADNYSLNKPIAFDETGFKGSDDFTYRAQAWEFLLAGGSIFSNLDYSFTVDHPDGTNPVAPPTPGGGSPALRRQLRILRAFMEKLDFLKMAPAAGAGSAEPATSIVTVFAEPGKQYGVYVRGKASAVTLKLAAGKYRVEWIDTDSGRTVASSTLEVRADDATALKAPEYSQDIALRLLRR
jgi:hypothetical protein